MRALLLVPALLLAACSCPDLAVQAVVFTYGDGVDPSRVSLDVTDADSGEPVLTAASPDEAMGLAAGIYDLTFYQDGVQANALEDLCTEGALTGCDAEAFESEGGITPNIIIEVFEDTIVATLEANGSCP